VHPDYLRFDFSHFSKVTDEELKEIEKIVNQKIRENIALNEMRNVPIQEAKDMGAMALFGEKYGDEVRVIVFDKDFSVELCGGTHVDASGKIGLFKITAESAIAAGIRRIEGLTAAKAEAYMLNDLERLNEIRELLKNPKDIVKGVKDLQDEIAVLKKKLDGFASQQVSGLKQTMKDKVEKIGGINFIGEVVDINDANGVKELAFSLKRETENVFMVFGANLGGKAHLTIMMSDNIVDDKGLDASQMIRDIAKEVNGGGGGQAFYATAGGKDPSGLNSAIHRAKQLLKEKVDSL